MRAVDIIIGMPVAIALWLGVIWLAAVVLASIRKMFFVCMLLAPAIAGAQPYYYAGVTGTNDHQYITEASLIIKEKPECFPCHLVAWTMLWDKGRTGQFVEAGVGYRPLSHCDRQGKLMVWYATRKEPTGVTVGCVGIGEKVTVSLQKLHGLPYVYAKWVWPGGSTAAYLYVPKWFTTGGIAPTKVEVWSKYEQPTPVAVDVVRHRGWGGHLQETPPYRIVPPSDIDAFTVRNE